MSVQLCAEKLRDGDPERFLQVMAAPKPARVKLFPLYAFNLELARIPQISPEPMIGLIRLKWWQDALESFANHPRIPKHDIAEPLFEQISSDLIHPLKSMVLARQKDIDGFPFHDKAELNNYLTETTGMLTYTAAQMLSQRKLVPSEKELCLKTGQAIGTAQWLQALAPLNRKNISPIATDTNVKRNNLAKMALERLSANHQALKHLPSESRAAFFGILPAKAILQKSIRDPHACQAGRLSLSEARIRLITLRQAFLKI